jgi:hypothetical protein
MFVCVDLGATDEHLVIWHRKALLWIMKGFEALGSGFSRRECRASMLLDPEDQDGVM